MPIHIWTESPIEERWRQLRYLKYPSNVQRLLSGALKSERPHHWSATDAERQSEAIASSIAQADEYFHASYAVTLATKPLLQFYGVECLAKAMILATSPDESLSKFRYHGLATNPSAANEADSKALAEYAGAPESWAVEEEFAVTNDGVFPKLAEVSDDPKIPNRCVIRLRELLMRIPDLAMIYEHQYGKSGEFVRLHGQLSPGSEGQSTICFAVHDHDTVLRTFPELSKGFERVDHLGPPAFQTTKDCEPIASFGRVVAHSIVGEYLVRPHALGFVKTATMLFAASFILSNVVRYKPAFWMSTLEGRTSGSIAIIEALCSVIERQFPHEALDSIWNQRHSFGSPGYLG